MATKLQQSNYNIRDSWVETNMSNEKFHRLHETARRGKGSRANEKTLHTTNLLKAIKETYNICLVK